MKLFHFLTNDKEKVKAKKPQIYFNFVNPRNFRPFSRITFERHLFPINQRVIGKRANTTDDLLCTICFILFSSEKDFKNFYQIHPDCFFSVEFWSELEWNESRSLIELENTFRWYQVWKPWSEKRTREILNLNISFIKASTSPDNFSLLVNDVNHHNNFGLAMKSAQFVTTKYEGDLKQNF